MPRTYEEIIAALPEDEREIVSKYEQAQADRRVQDGIKTYLAGHPVPDEKGTLARLQRIEEAHAKAIEASELRYHVFRESMAAGVDPALLENVPFTTKESATQWIKRLG
jgi:putative hemolysin